MTITMRSAMTITMSSAHSPSFPSLHQRTTHSPTLLSLYLRHSTFSNPSVASPTSQFILQPFFRFSYVTSSSLTSPGEPPMLSQDSFARTRLDAGLENDYYQSFSTNCNLNVVHNDSESNGGQRERERERKCCYVI